MSTRSRHVKLTLRGILGLSARSAALGRCAYPTSATDLHHEHPTDRLILESPPFSAFAFERGFHAACPAETLAASMIEWSLA